VNPRLRRVGAALALLILLLSTIGCATVDAPGAGSPRDPWEGWNRKVFSFNEALDENLLKPVATAYEAVVPGVVRKGVENFFNNFADAWSAVNNLLQGKFERAFTDVVRVGTNTVFGIGGVLDIASEAGIEHTYEDFGQTLGRWGFGPGPYVVWPLFGPSNVRESFALPLDRGISPALAIKDDGVQWGLSALQVVNVRAGLLAASKVLEGAALDKYSFVRDAYLQRRRSLVYDGDPPDEPEPPEPADAAPLGVPPPAPTKK
jgi:phospholipid-binding lipoprotein MlaA